MTLRRVPGTTFPSCRWLRQRWRRRLLSRTDGSVGRGRSACPLSRPDLDKVYKRRLPIYQDVSVFTIDTDGRRPDAIALEVLAELTRLPSTPYQIDGTAAFVEWETVASAVAWHGTIGGTCRPRGRGGSYSTAILEPVDVSTDS